MNQQQPTPQIYRLRAQIAILTQEIRSGEFAALILDRAELGYVQADKARLAKLEAKLVEMEAGR